jgi:outer membrane protein insertion porin family
MFSMHFNKGFLGRLIVAFVFVTTMACIVPAAQAQSIVVEGNRRIDVETIKSYFSGSDEGKVNTAVKELYATGLFSDVHVTRSGGSIVVHVTENNIINRVFFEGNSKLKSDVLMSEIQSKTRGPFNESTVQADVERILDLYRRGGRSDATVKSRIVDLPNGRVDVVFTIDEGSKTGVKTIEFSGNTAFSSYRLRNLMQTTEMSFMSFLKTTDVYDPDKISADLELIRRFYLKNGYADFRITGTDAVYVPEKRGYVITISVDEGQPYKLSSVSVHANLPDVSDEGLKRQLRLSAGDTYNGDLVEKTIEGLTREVARAGYAFSSARPRADRDPVSHTIALNFVIEEGPRVYVERINIRGNTRTRDYVIRREFPLAEGDAYNRVLVDKAEKRLNNLGYFKKVHISTEPGSSADRVVLNVDVEDQATGSFAISGGYSTLDGLIAEVSVSESNFLGRGQYARFAVSGGQHTRGVEFNFTEPYFMDQRIAAGFDLFHKVTDNSRYSLYDNWVTGGTLRLGLPITDEVSLSPRYTIYQNRIAIPNDTQRPYNDCTSPIGGFTPGPGVTNPDSTVGANATYNCLTNGEASLAVKQLAGTRIISQVGYSLSYNTLDNNKSPTQGLIAELRQDIAGAGGDARFVRTTGDTHYYVPVMEDITGVLRAQAGDVFAFGGDKLRMVDNFNLGPSLVRGFAPGGIGARDISYGTGSLSNGLGGTKYAGVSTEIQFPLFGMPRDLGLKGALFADAGTIFGYEGKTNLSELVGLAPGAACQAPNPSANFQGNCLNLVDSHKIRSSVGASLLWASPLGPIRFDYAFVLSKDSNDVGQAFRFSGGSSF